MVSSHGRFVWYELMTTDMAAAKAFYAKVVGWGTQDASMPGMAYTLFTAGATAVGGLMELPEAAKKMGAKPIWIGYVGVDDVDAAAARIKELGGAVHVPPTDVPGISRFSVVADPQMATLALFKWQNPGQQQAAEPGKPGHVSWHELFAADGRRRSLSTASCLSGRKRMPTSFPWTRIVCSPPADRRSAAFPSNLRWCRLRSGFTILTLPISTRLRSA